MSDSLNSTASMGLPAGASSDAVAIGPPAPSRGDVEISSLLDSLDEAATESGQSLAKKRASAPENKLVQARLGIASALHTALRAKHPPTASHSLRVALGCSSWAAAMELDDEERDALEVAALLHDVGKIGVPDKVLLKPGRLLPEETALMTGHAAHTIEILTSCGVSRSVLEVVHYSRAWYSCPPGQQDREGDELPLGARMLSIIDAFDSMTTDHVRSRPRAALRGALLAGPEPDDREAGPPMAASLIRRRCRCSLETNRELPAPTARTPDHGAAL
jgi:hypothetical protein